jgi:hypothetical protein
VNPVIQHREWLIQPDALQAISASYQSQAERAGIFSHQSQQNSLLSVEDGIGVVAIEGPILRKADLFAKMFYGATAPRKSPMPCKKSQGAMTSKPCSSTSILPAAQ